MTENAQFVSLRGVRKSFDNLEVLHGIDLDVAEHKVVCLIGASGSGKSTLLRCINLLEKIDEGTIAVDGQTVTGTKLDVNRLRQKIGIVFQAYNLFPHLTVLQNVTRPRHTRARSCGRSASTTRQTSSPTACPAGSSNGSRSCGRSRPGRS